MSFDFVPPKEFFELLYDDEDFCNQLGKLVLAASVFESSLRGFLLSRRVTSFSEKTSLGQLINLLKANELISENTSSHYSDMLRKRNYLIHNLYALFSEEIEETLLPRNELVDIDIHEFSEKARNEAADFRFFAESVMECTENKGSIL